MKKLFLILVLSLWSSSWLYAQDTLSTQLYKFSLDELIQLQDQNLVTTASKKAEKIEDAPSVITVIRKEEIQNFGATNILDLLQRVTGVYIAGSGLIPDNMIAMRGDYTVHYSNHVLLLLNGRPIRDNSSGGLRMAFNLMFPIERIERIEVIHGPGSVLYGTGAYTGVINVITKTSSLQPLSVEVQGGGFNRVQTSIAKGFEKNDLQINVAGKLVSEQGWNFNATDGLVGVNRSIDMLEKGYGLETSLNYKGFSLQAYHGKSTQRAMYFPGAWSSYTLINGYDTTRNVFKDYNAIHTLSFVDAGYVHTITKAWAVQANVTLNQNRFVETAEEAAEDIAVTNATDLLGELTTTLDLGKNGSLILGGLINRTTGQQTFPVSLKKEKTDAEPFESVGFGTFNIFNFNIGKNTDPPFIIEPYQELYYSAYLQADYRVLPRLKLIVGGQYNKAPNVSGDFVPRLGMVANLSEEFTFKLLHGQAFRNGTSIERFVRVNFVFGNENLVPEKIQTTELNLTFNDITSRFSSSLTYFYSVQRNLIVRSVQAAIDNNIPAYEYFVNSGSRYVQGVELEMCYEPLDRLEILASLNANDSYDELHIRSPFSGQDTLYIAPNLQAVPQANAKFGFHYTTKNGFSFGVFNSFWSGVRRISSSPFRNTLSPTVNPPIQAYHLLTVKARVNIGELFNRITLNGLTLFLYGDNLLNSKVMMVEPQNNVNTLPAYGGISVLGGVNYRFKK